jgi:osmotically inducible protein OsmC
VRYTAKTHTSGGRRGGVSHSDDGRLDVSAMGLVANRMKVKLPADVAVDAEIDLCNSGDVYFLRARLNVRLPGIEREVAQAIVGATHGETCAYSNATRGNVEVTLSVV